MRSILHIDMDAFFASVEVLDNPALRGRPVIVGGTPEGRGVVAAASYEARRFGVHSAMSSWKARRLCPQAVVIRPRHARYAEVSRLIFAIFHEYTPLVEGLSLDEAFLDVTGSTRLFGDAETIGRAIKRSIRERIGLTASVGVAPNKFLAKLASDLQKPDGFVVIRGQEAATMLAGLPIGRLWGVGRVMQRTLEQVGVRHIGDLAGLPVEVLERRFGSQTHHLLELARGIDERPVVPDGASRSIGAETTFAGDIADTTELLARLDAQVDRVARRLRRQGCRGRTVHLKARYADFTTVTRAVTLPSPTALTRVIREAARDLLVNRLGRSGRALRLLGVSVSNLEHAAEGQAELPLDEQEQREGRIDALLDRLRDTYGDRIVGRGAPRPGPRDEDDA